VKNIVLPLILLVATASLCRGQGFGLKELLDYKDHGITYFHKQVKAKGYSYEKNKYDEKNEFYSYVYLENIADDLHEIQYDNTHRNVHIIFGTTDVRDYERLKDDLELLQFKFVKYVPKHENGRSVLMLVFSDGNTQVHLYNSYIECADKQLVRYYRVKVL